MARTWQNRLPPGAPIIRREGPAPEAEFRLSSNQDSLTWRVRMPGRIPIEAPVEATLGGDRHGYSLLARVGAIEGVKLGRAPLVETRYLLGPDRALLFSPGHSAEKPASYQTALGRVLSPQFETKCLACHGAPSGVRCEHCHGAGDAHVKSSGPIVNPARLSNAAQIARCGQCHADGHELADPMPDDLLIANQANALTQSECYIQSGQGLNCSTCHNPHQDAASNDRRYVKACLSCHGAVVKQRAAVCPVSPAADCIRCHMPAQPKDSFRMVDHWIRVPNGGGQRRGARTQIRPRRMFLRMILAVSPDQAIEARSKLEAGADFFDLARLYSRDPSAGSGGFLGAMWLDQMEPKLAAAAADLGYGETSPVVEAPAGPVLLQRLSRDFRERADVLFLQAADLKRKGQLREALDKNQEALKIYPQFLRALLFRGISFGEHGDAGGAAGILELAARLYPRDIGVQLNLGIAYGSAGRTEDEIRAYRRALEGEPDLIAAYLNLGAALLTIGRADEAVQTYRRAIEVNPLAAAVYYNLSLIYDKQGRKLEAKQMREVAAKIEPQVARRPR